MATSDRRGEMGNREMTRRMAFTAIVGALLCAALVTTSAVAKGPPTKETASNNLSVPTIMIGNLNAAGETGETGPSCTDDDDLVLPSGDPLSGFEVAGDYYVQGVHTWQADCVAATAAEAEADWGDNMAGDAKLKVGQPIRVELGLLTTDVSMQGFEVIKLEPSKLDRESKYGTLATGDATTGYAASPVNLAARVYDSGATWSVRKVGSDDYFIDPELIGVEINATGKVVYGYNLRVDAVGQYEITFYLPNVTVTASQDGGTVAGDGHSVSLIINVTGGGGGGGKK
jgi:hypothetical protein